jgi:CSLREA domain-containing protein
MIGTKTERASKGRAPALGFLLAALVVACLVLTAQPANAVTFTVNTTSDRPDESIGNGFCSTGVGIVHEDGGIELECTLRAAIQEANANPNVGGPDVIRFAISGPGPHTITPDSQLPTITQPATINGYSQPGASVNTATTGTNAVLKIVLDGSDAGSTPTQPVDGLVVTARNTIVRGLVINNGFRSGVLFDTEIPADAGRTLEGCFIGTDAAGIAADGNGGGVIIDDGEGNLIGGNTLAARNLISGNNDTGIFISSAANGNTIQGNLIGTQKNGFSDLGNRTGIHVVGGSNNNIGGNGAARNTIAFNRFHGIQVQEVSAESPGTANRIVSNSIFDNAGLGIQLGAEAVAGGVTPNDPRDGDTGPNGLQNFPVISSAVISNGSTTIRGSLNSTPNRTFTIQFFNSPVPDPSGNGEGKTFLGQKDVDTNRNGNASFTFVPNRVAPLSTRVTATATAGNGNTSEFSNARIVTRPPL